VSAKTLRALLALMLVMTVACGGKKEEEHADEHGHGAAESEAKGPHGGRMLRDGDFGIEVTIFEQGVPPEFRLYAFDGDKPIAPSQVRARMQLVRLDRTEQIAFAPKNDYLLGNVEVVEPHSFTVKLRVTHDGKSRDLGEAQLRRAAAQQNVERFRTEIIPAAESVHEAITEGYRLGKFGYLEVLDARRTLAQARLQLVAAQRELELARVDVERLTGGWQ